MAAPCIVLDLSAGRGQQVRNSIIYEVRGEINTTGRPASAGRLGYSSEHPQATNNAIVSLGTHAMYASATLIIRTPLRSWTDIQNHIK